MSLRGMSYHPFKQTYRLSDDVAVNYLMHTVLPA
jgi:2-polyprenyl-3-methyl-5-hydroxy-6-metoxy-1,4-benzoquinol methylase